MEKVEFASDAWPSFQQDIALLSAAPSAALPSFTLGSDDPLDMDSTRPVTPGPGHGPGRPGLVWGAAPAWYGGPPISIPY